MARDCPKKIVTCDVCGETIVKEQYNEHMDAKAALHVPLLLAENKGLRRLASGYKV